MSRGCLAAVVAAAICCAPTGWAQGSEITGRSPWWLLAQALLSLAVVVGIIYLVYFGIRRLGDRQLDAGADGPMRVIQARHLGGDRWLYLIEVEDRRIVVGGTSGQIARIAEWRSHDDAGSGGQRRDEM
ncbi:MAG: FliO/MopB family protein [Armatimonadota bacterium]